MMNENAKLFDRVCEAMHYAGRTALADQPTEAIVALLDWNEGNALGNAWIQEVIEEELAHRKGEK